jgi:hypothetical protein
MRKIRVDPDLLSHRADEINQASGEILRAGESLLTGIAQVLGASRFADLRTSARNDASAARDVLDRLQRDLSGNSEKLAALSRAFQSADDETIRFLNGMTDSSGRMQVFFGAQPFPNSDGFEPYDLPQTAMAVSNWAVMYAYGVKTILHTFRNGELVGNIIGTWTDPKTGKKYYVVDLGNGQYGYIPADRLSAPIDHSKIFTREGVFSNGEKDPCQDFPAPLGSDSWMPNWRKAGDPWQDLQLGYMQIQGLRNAKFGTTAHANLCGEFSVMYSVGETDVEAGLSRFAQLTGLGYWDEQGKKVEYTGTQVLQNPNHATSAYDLTRFLQAYGYQSKSSSGILPTPDTLASQLQAGHKFIFLTELDTLKEIPSKETGEMVPNPTYGQLVPGAPPTAWGRAAHWVAVTDVFQDGTGGFCVEVFNAYTGQKETYSWDTFAKTCQQPGNSEGSFSYVEAWK